MVDFLIAMLILVFALALFGAGIYVVWRVYLDRPSHLTPGEAMAALKAEVGAGLAAYLPAKKPKVSPAGPPDLPPSA
ncbi:MAG: hypothetical protein OEY97_06410 [Nitrospirota bacterium]|nr:hypothetical protein [Nitrospirota bacterium]